MDVINIIANSSGNYINPEIAEGIKLEVEKQKAMPVDEKRKYLESCFNNSIGELEDYNCEICKNKGFIVHFDENLEKSFERCKCMDIRITNRILKNSGLYEQVQKMNFKAFVVSDEWQKKCLETCLNFCKNKVGWLFFGGQSGSGKTHLCTAVTGYLIKKGNRAKYMLWRDEITQLKQIVNDAEMYQAKINLLKTVPVLYIDDFFKTEKDKIPTQADINVAYEILNSRYNSKLITIISSELTTGDIIEIDEAIAGRIIEMSKDYCLNLKKDRARNYRLKGCDEI